MCVQKIQTQKGANRQFKKKRLKVSITKGGGGVLPQI